MLGLMWIINESYVGRLISLKREQVNQDMKQVEAIIKGDNFQCYSK